MTRTLILMRHAKSSWDSPALRDHDRPLNGRGRASASALGDWMRTKGLHPDEVRSSSSARTVETCERLGLAVAPHYTDALYHAGPGAILGQLRQATGHTVLMLGHNPGIADFAQRLLRAPPDHPRFADYPTCATLVAIFDLTDWADVAWHSGTATDFVIPRGLME